MMRRCRIFLFAVLCAGLFPACDSAAQTVRTYGYKVEESVPHDVASYTQGLFFEDGVLYEAAGQYGESSLREVDLRTGKVLRRLNFDGHYFVEGACALRGRLYVLTWQEHECLVFDLASWDKLGTLRYTGEGWGLTTDGKNLIMSDGSNVIRFRDPKTFQVLREIKVKINGRDLEYLNELEYIDGKIWANVYGTDAIVIIDPASGVVTATVDCSGLLPSSLRKPSTDVFNGIAYNPANGGIYVTGKYWPRLYRISIK